MGMMVHPKELKAIIDRPFASGQSSVSPGANGNATIAHGLSATPGFAAANIIADLGGIDVHVEIQAISATLITLRFSTSAGVDVTTGGPYNVAWLAR